MKALQNQHGEVVDEPAALRMAAYVDRLGNATMRNYARAYGAYLLTPATDAGDPVAPALLVSSMTRRERADIQAELLRLREG